MKKENDVYPLGTVVKLKKERVKELIGEDVEESIKVIVLDRLVPIGEKTYVEYAGVIYPISNTGTQMATIYFSKESIEKVVHMGYSDEREIQFVKDKKNRLNELGIVKK